MKLDLNNIEQRVTEYFTESLSNDWYVQPYKKIFEIQINELIENELSKISKFFDNLPDDSVVYISSKANYNDIICSYDFTETKHRSFRFNGRKSYAQFPFDLERYNTVITDSNINVVVTTFMIVQILNKLCKKSSLYTPIFKHESQKLLNDEKI